MVGEGSSNGLAGSAADPRVELSAIVVAYRQPRLLEEALAALAAGSRVPDEIVVVDVDPLEPYEPVSGAPSVRVLQTDDNPGYAAACNRGARQATGRWLLFLNADVAVTETAVEAVLEEAGRDDSIGIATPRLVRQDGTLDHACHRGIPSVADSLCYKLRLDRLRPSSKRLGHYRLTWLDPEDTHDVEACTGAFMLVRREALEAVGGWDELYRFYGEDLDLCLRVGEAGWRVRYVGSETALHHKGAASYLHADPRTLSAEQQATRDRVRRQTVDSHERFYRQHLEAGTSRALRPLVRLMFAAQRRRVGGTHD